MKGNKIVSYSVSFVWFPLISPVKQTEYNKKENKKKVEKFCGKFVDKKTSDIQVKS